MRFPRSNIQWPGIFLFLFLLHSGCGRKEYVQFSREEQREIARLSAQCACQVKMHYDYEIRDGKAVPKSGPDNKYAVSFEWESVNSDKSICQQDTAYLKSYALKVLPDLLESMRFINDYHNVEFTFSVKDKANSINGFSCYKHIVIKR